MCRVAFRFVHTADLHLDSPLRSLALRDAGLAARVGAASRTVLVRIVDLCLDERVDALLIAGDLYDGDQSSMKTAGFLIAQLRRLNDAGIRVLVIRGNHDSMSGLTRQLTLPPNVHVFGPTAGVETMGTGARPVAVHGISFAGRQARENLLDRFAPPVPGAINIGMLHTSLDGSAGHDPYAPCSVAALRATGFDYWALGHIHARIEIPGRPHLVMPGIPQGRDIGEAGAKSVSLVDVAADGTVTVETRDLSVLRFERVAVTLDGVAHWPEVEATLVMALQAVRQAIPGDLAVRPVLAGATPLAWRIRRDADDLCEAARGLAESLGGMWIDKLQNLTLAPEGAGSPGALADLEHLVANAIPPGPALALEMERAAEDLMRVLPAALRDLLGDTPEDIAARRDVLLAEGVADVLAHLRGQRAG